MCDKEILIGYPSYIQKILDVLEEKGYEVYLVGGCLRDVLLGRECTDYDLCTNALPSQVRSLFSKTDDVGIQHGTVRVHLEGHCVEITTFRKEANYQDHRHPDSVEFVSDLESDLARRDLTINAMAYHPKKGLIDLFGGREDLKYKRIRCVGNPDIRFQEDALRMLRAHRFAAKLGFRLEEKTRQAIHRQSSLLSYVAIERITHELDEILRCDPYQIEQMIDLLSGFLPELGPALCCEQNSPWHDCNVLHHSLKAITYLRPYDKKLAYALWMHDLGKIDTKTTIDGRDHFKGHPQVSAAIAKKWIQTLKLPVPYLKTIPDLILYHDISMNEPLKVIKELRIEKGFSHVWMQDLLEIKRCDLWAHSQQGKKTLKQWQIFHDVYQQACLERPMEVKDLAISGHDLTFLSGKEIGQALKDCLHYSFQDPRRNTKENLLHWIKERKSIYGDAD